MVLCAYLSPVPPFYGDENPLLNGPYRQDTVALGAGDSNCTSNVEHLITSGQYVRGSLIKFNG